MLTVHNVASDQLKQVVVLGRHNIRTPLANLKMYTSKEQLKWSQENGFLTTKGALLEEYLGEYFSDYLRKEELLTNECPNDSLVHVYANIYQRTRKTAEHFIRSAFKQCNITINVKPNITSDPVFYLVILNDTESFQTIARKEMQEKLDEMDLKDAYMRLNTILDIKTSYLCKVNSLCDLTKENDNITLIYGDEPNVIGPLKIGNEITDALLMAYYDGENLSKIGWGQIQPEDWKLLAKLTKKHLMVRFGCTHVAKHIAKPLLNYIKQVFLEEKHKFTLLVGHDSCINSVLTSIGVEPYDLAGQNEYTPIGGKVVFEKWYDDVDYYLKIKYVYLSTEQIRHGARISEDNPVHKVYLKLRDVEAFTSAKILSDLEPTGICRSDCKIPDGMTIEPWKPGRQQVWDATCVDTVAPAHVLASVGGAGLVARAAEYRKKLKYANLAQRMSSMIRTQNVTNEEVLRLVGQKRKLLQIIKQIKVAYLGRVLRRDKYELLQLIIMGKVAGKRKAGRRKNFG
ncbi:uncharacterized protein LOC113232132 [Hyposmocoma kahamanoa]|uniref:uncharacterized protein LOC113232132 n=1 Tax=Hyposmocoma kahamanoa TaxID=1477025 RepID=UPI000E6D7423|nr:uncharacterized protein LOC113232132 [Hyposmocoma kahamanoa]